MPNEVKKDEYCVLLPSSLAAKVYLYNEWLSSDQDKTVFAAKIGVALSHLDCLLSFKYRSEMDALEKALLGLGKHIEITVI